MDIATLIYLASVSGNLGMAFGVMGFFAILLGLVFNIVIAVARTEDPNFNVKPRWWIVYTGVFLIFASAFLPSKETIYMMAGAAVVQDIAESPEASRIGDRLLVLLETKLDQAIEELPEAPAPAPVEEPTP